MTMSADDVYQWLMASAHVSGYDEFDRHVAAAILALGLSEAGREGRVACERIGLDGAAIARMISEMFPDAGSVVDDDLRHATLTVDAEEQSLRDILWMYATRATPLTRDLTAMIARRCMQPHHLWQDLGLRDRKELTRLMTRHFATLAERNRNDMKWKKFLYRLVCRSEGFSLCAAPVCSECDDFAGCFSGEDGEALLARSGFAQGVAVQ